MEVEKEEKPIKKKAIAKKTVTDVKVEDSDNEISFKKPNVDFGDIEKLADGVLLHSTDTKPKEKKYKAPAVMTVSNGEEADLTVKKPKKPKNK